MRYATFDRLLGLLLLLTVAAASGLAPMQADTWWQLRAGQDMWAAGRVILTDVYSFTAYGAPWTNHEWLAELVYYGAWKAGGLPFVTLLSVLLIAAAWGLTWSLTAGRAIDAFLWTAAALVPASTWWEPRPHAFSLFFLSLSAALMVRRRLWWLPPVFLVWANAHGGVLLGFVLLAAGLGVQVLRDPALGRRAAAVAAACAAAATATPLGLSFWIEIPRSLGRIRLYPLDEWRPPALTDGLMLPFWIVAAVLVGALARRAASRERLPAADATLCACALALLPLAITASRNVGPFLMMAVPSVTRLLARPAPASPRREHRALNTAIAGAAALAVIAGLAWAYHTRLPRLRWDPVPPAALAAIEACPGNLYNRYDEGGILIWFAPGRRVFLDGRQDPFAPALVLEHVRMETAGAPWQPLFARFDIRCAYLPATSPTARQLASAGWTPLFQDARWVVLRQ